MRFAPLLLLAACARIVVPDPVDTDDTDVVLDDTAPPPDTLAVWDTQGDPGVQGDTFRVTDRPIGPTPQDGVWGGFFDLREVTPFGANPRCRDGWMSLTVDGTAERHVVARLDCDVWQPQAGALTGEYGPLTGIGFATMDPADTSRITLDFSMSAQRMARVDFTEVIRFGAGDTVDISIDTVVGIFNFQQGHRFNATLAKGALPPVDTDDTDDTDLVDTDDTDDTDLLDTDDTDLFDTDVIATGDTADTEVP